MSTKSFKRLACLHQEPSENEKLSLKAETFQYF